MQAGILAGTVENQLLLDVTPLSLGIEIYGGVVSKIIHRNSTIPASASETFTTGVDGQTNVLIHVVQGERELAKDCRSLARFDLKDIAPMPAGIARIEVRFLIDANGILNVTARDARTGKEQSMDVKPSYGLTDRADGGHDRERRSITREEDLQRRAGGTGARGCGRDSAGDRKGETQRRVARAWRSTSANRSRDAIRQLQTGVSRRRSHAIREQDRRAERSHASVWPRT